MVKRGSVPSAASFARSSVVLSCAVEKNFALEAEVSRLRHHVSVLSRRLHRAEKEVSTLADSLRIATAAPTVIPSSPTSTVVTVLGGGRDPENPEGFSEETAEELPRGVVTPTVIPSSPPPFEVAVGVGGPSSDWFGSEAVASSLFGGVVEDPVAVSVAVASSAVAVQAPESSVAEPVADGERASRGTAGVAVGDDGGESTVGLPGSKPGRRRKSKKRRVHHDLTNPVPLVPESDGSSSPPRMRMRTGGKSTLAPAAGLPILPFDFASGAERARARIERDTYVCLGCRCQVYMFTFEAFGRVCKCGGVLERLPG